VMPQIFDDPEKIQGKEEISASSHAPVLPDYGDACITSLVPALLEGTITPEWLPEEIFLADRVILLVLDGLGWEQLQRFSHTAPVMTGLPGRPITTVAPSTTATALTSISTGRPPAAHGVLGYRMTIGNSVLNALRWSTSRGDARRNIDPLDIQPLSVFGDQRPPVVTRAEFLDSGFTQAHLRGSRLVGYKSRAELVEKSLELLQRPEPFVYVYWDGIDRTGHEFGLGDRYEEELADCDLMISEILNRAPIRTAVVVTADHGQVTTDGGLLELPSEITTYIVQQSGEARFRWLHALNGAEEELFLAAHELFHEVAWIRRYEDIQRENWFGQRLGPSTRSRIGDVALVARSNIGFRDPAEHTSIDLIARHGSLTSEEVLVPAIGLVT